MKTKAEEHLPLRTSDPSSPLSLQHLWLHSCPLVQTKSFKTHENFLNCKLQRSLVSLAEGSHNKFSKESFWTSSDSSASKCDVTRLNTIESIESYVSLPSLLFLCALLSEHTSQYHKFSESASVTSVIICHICHLPSNH